MHCVYVKLPCAHDVFKDLREHIDDTWRAQWRQRTEQQQRFIAIATGPRLWCLPRRPLTPSCGSDDDLAMAMANMTTLAAGTVVVSAIGIVFMLPMYVVDHHHHLHCCNFVPTLPPVRQISFTRTITSRYLWSESRYSCQGIEKSSLAYTSRRQPAIIFMLEGAFRFNLAPIRTKSL